MYVFCRPLSLCILYTTLAYFGFVAEQGLVNLHHHTLPTQEKRRVNRHQPPAADISQILVGLDSGRLADLGLLCSLGHRVLSHPPEDFDQPLLQGEFRLVKKGAGPYTTALFAAIIYTAPPIVKLEGNPTTEDAMFDRFWDMTVPSLVLDVISTLHVHHRAARGTSLVSRDQPPLLKPSDLLIWIPSKDRSNIQYAKTHLSPFAVPAFVSRRNRNWPIAAALLSCKFFCLRACAVET